LTTSGIFVAASCALVASRRAGRQNAGGLEALIAPLVVFSADRACLTPEWTISKPTPGGREHLHGLRSAIEKDGILLPAEDRRNLVQQTTATPTNCFRFAASCQIERAISNPNNRINKTPVQTSMAAELEAGPERKVARKIRLKAPEIVPCL
jgi:hypothetical protein